LTWAITPNRWTRSSGACSGTRALLAAGLLALAQLTGPAARAQDQELDPVSIQAMTNAFIALRFVALTLETPDEQGQALNGLVRASLAGDRLDAALDEALRIEDGIWKARSLKQIATYHAERGETEAALETLLQAADAVDPTQPMRDGGEVLRAIAEQQSRLGAFEAAIETARLLPDGTTRIRALISAARASRGAMYGGATWEETAKGVMEEAFAQLSAMEAEPGFLVELSAEIGRIQVEAGDGEGAVRSFEFARRIVEERAYMGRNRTLAFLASALVEGGDQPQAMEVVRLIPDEGDRARGLASIARVLGQKYGIDSSVPLFVLAYESATRVVDPEQRNDVLRHVMIEQTRIDRLADAFTTAGAIGDRKVQAEALLAMGEVLIRKGKYDEALVLVDYIPYVSLRAPIFAAVAEQRGLNGQATGASTLLARSLEPTGVEPLPEYLPSALRRVLNAQLAVGQPDSDAVVFARARELAYLIPDELTRIRALMNLAVALARRGDKAEADRSIGGAYRVAFLHKGEDAFSEAMADIVEGQLVSGEILSAFDTAARIPLEADEDAYDRDNKGNFVDPKLRSLTAVAAEAARKGKTDLALRAARQIDHAPARAAALAEIAVAIATPDAGITQVQPLDTGATMMLRQEDMLEMPAPTLLPPAGG